MDTVYIDVLLIENFFMNFLLLYLLSRFTKNKTCIWRLIASAIFGAMYVIIVFFPGLQFFYTILIKFSVSVIMIIIAFFPLKILAVIRSIFLFYLEAFIFGGLLLGTLFLKSSALNTVNGALLVESPTPSPTFLILGSIVATIITKYGFDFFENHSINEKLKLKLEIVLNNQSCVLTALIDTGNSLKDPITNEPVIIVYYKAIFDILPEELKEVIEHDYSYEIFKSRVIKSVLKSRIRIIPYKALGVENGLLLGVKVDLIISEQSGISTMIKEPVIAFYNMPISNMGDYQALTYPGIIRRDEKDENKK